MIPTDVATENEPTGPHPRDVMVTFPWLKTWVPVLISFAFAVGTVVMVWRDARAEVQDLRRTNVEIVRKVEAVEVRVEAQEQAQRVLEKKIDELDRKLQLVVCRLIPGSPGCP